MKRKKLQTDIRQQQIVQAVLDIVANEGPRAVSMAAVAGRLGLVPSAIYRHFHSKAACLDAAMDLIGRKLQANVDQACRRAARPLERLERLLWLHLQMVRENIAIPRIVFGEDVHAGQPDRRDRARAIFQGYVEGIAGLVRQGQADGSIRADVSPQTAAMMFLGMILPAGIRWHLSQGQFDLPAHAEHAWRMYRDALVPREMAGEAGEIKNAPEAIAREIAHDRAERGDEGDSIPEVLL